MKKLLFLIFIILIISFFISSKLIIGKEVYVREVKDFFVEKKVIPILFGGDVMLGRNVEILIKKNGDSYSFGNTTELLKSHITVVNLEGTIPNKHIHTIANGFSFSFPKSTGKILKDNGITAVTLANNHSFDSGRDGFEETKQELSDNNIFYFGAYDTTSPDFFETKLGDTKIIIYGVNMISSSWNEKIALETTKLMRENNPDAYLIAFLHWGKEYDLKQGEVQRNFAHKLIDNGVNAIVGSHPHVTQGIEVYKNSPIFYSFGNFIFDQYFSPYTERGYLLSIDKNQNDLVYKIIPVGSEKSHAFIAGGDMYNLILNAVADSSDIDLRENIKNGQILIKLFQ